MGKIKLTQEYIIRMKKVITEAEKLKIDLSKIIPMKLSEICFRHNVPNELHLPDKLPESEITVDLIEQALMLIKDGKCVKRVSKTIKELIHDICVYKKDSNDYGRVHLDSYGDIYLLKTDIRYRALKDTESKRLTDLTKCVDYCIFKEPLWRDTMEEAAKIWDEAANFHKNYSYDYY